MHVQSTQRHVQKYTWFRNDLPRSSNTLKGELWAVIGWGGADLNDRWIGEATRFLRAHGAETTIDAWHPDARILLHPDVPRRQTLTPEKNPSARTVINVFIRYIQYESRGGVLSAPTIPGKHVSSASSLARRVLDHVQGIEHKPTIRYCGIMSEPFDIKQYLEQGPMPPHGNPSATGPGPSTYSWAMPGATSNLGPGYAPRVGPPPPAWSLSSSAASVSQGSTATASELAQSSGTTQGTRPAYTGAPLGSNPYTSRSPQSNQYMAETPAGFQPLAPGSDRVHDHASLPAPAHPLPQTPVTIRDASRDPRDKTASDARARERRLAAQGLLRSSTGSQVPTGTGPLSSPLQLQPSGHTQVYVPRVPSRAPGQPEGRSVTGGPDAAAPGSPSSTPRRGASATPGTGGMLEERHPHIDAGGPQAASADAREGTEGISAGGVEPHKVDNNGSTPTRSAPDARRSQSPSRKRPRTNEEPTRDPDEALQPAQSHRDEMFTDHESIGGSAGQPTKIGNLSSNDPAIAQHEAKVHDAANCRAQNSAMERMLYKTLFQKGVMWVSPGILIKDKVFKSLLKLAGLETTSEPEDASVLLVDDGRSHAPGTPNMEELLGDGERRDWRTVIHYTWLGAVFDSEAMVPLGEYEIRPGE